MQKLAPDTPIKPDTFGDIVHVGADFLALSTAERFQASVAE